MIFVIHVPSKPSIVFSSHRPLYNQPRCLFQVISVIAFPDVNNNKGVAEKDSGSLCILNRPQVFLDNLPSSDVMTFVARVCLLFQLVTVFPLVIYIIRVQFMLYFFGNIYPRCVHSLAILLCSVYLSICSALTGRISLKSDARVSMEA